MRRSEPMTASVSYSMTLMVPNLLVGSMLLNLSLYI